MIRMVLKGANVTTSGTTYFMHDAASAAIFADQLLDRVGHDGDYCELYEERLIDTITWGQQHEKEKV